MERFARYGLTPIPGATLSDYLAKLEEREDRPGTTPAPPASDKDKQERPAPNPLREPPPRPAGPDPRRTGPDPNRRIRPQ